MSGFEHIRFSVEDQVARLVFAHPDTLNALSRPLLREVITALDEIRDRAQARVLLLRGEGRAFSSGADLSPSASSAGAAGFDAGEVLEQYYNPLLERLFALPVPIVAAVQGPVVGAGCALALAADITVAARSAYFLQAFVRTGLVPDAGSMWLLPRLIGRARAQAMMMLAEKIPAEIALDWGMLYEVVDDDELEARGEALATRLAAGPTRAFNLIRQGVRFGLDSSLSQTLWMERQAQREAGATADFREGVAAFRQKRTPEFRGS